MKIVKTDGCVVSGIDIDGENIDYLTEEKKKDCYNKILDYFQNNYSENNFLNLVNFLTYYYGENTYLYTCEQCGDSVYETKVEI